jgi:hypothetical protein
MGENVLAILLRLVSILAEEIEELRDLKKKGE